MTKFTKIEKIKDKDNDGSVLDDKLQAYIEDMIINDKEGISLATTLEKERTEMEYSEIKKKLIRITIDKLRSHYSEKYGEGKFEKTSILKTFVYNPIGGVNGTTDINIDKPLLEKLKHKLEISNDDILNQMTSEGKDKAKRETK